MDNHIIIAVLLDTGNSYHVKVLGSKGDREFLARKVDCDEESDTEILVHMDYDEKLSFEDNLTRLYKHLDTYDGIIDLMERIEYDGEEDRPGVERHTEVC